MTQPSVLKNKTIESSSKEVSKETSKESSLDNATISAKFLESCKKFSEKPALLYKKDHTFGYIQYKRLLNLVENFTLSLEKLGVKKGDRVMAVSENRPEWVVSDLATISLGAIFTPVNATLTSEQIKEIIYEIQPKIIVISEKRQLSKLIEIKKEINKDIIIVYYNIEIREDLSEFKNDKCHFIEALQLNTHKNYSDYFKQKVGYLRGDDTISILYTLGPNGKYRGVELSHNNVLSNIQGTVEAIAPKSNDRFLSVLPLSHALEKTAGYYLPILHGCQIIYVTELSKFSQIAQRYKPTVIIGVPRLYEKTYQKIEDLFNKSRLKSYFFKRAVSKNKKKLTNWIYEQVVYRNSKKALGGNIRVLVSGGAALHPKVGKFFNDCKMPIMEGYGLTELSPIVTVNRLEHYKIGTVGKPLPNTHIKIANDGEILVKGPGLMKGYYNNGAGPQLYLEKGWFKTGDLGEFDEDGYLKIIGRKKEVIVLSTGKNVCPRSIETRLTLSPYIKQAVVVGDDRKHIAALLVPDIIKLQQKFWIRSKYEVINNKDVRAFLQDEIDKQLAGFARHEQIKKFALITTAFTKQNLFLNEDNSINRDKINLIYNNVIEELCD